jgi:tetratricopeptide (TPR) repeat protein
VTPLGRLICSIVAAVIATSAGAGCTSSPSTADTRERAYRANNVGVALLEQAKYGEAARAFREALAIDPSLAIAHLNLSLASLYAQDLEASQREADEAARQLPSRPEPSYVLGLLARAQNRTDAARAAFERVRQIAPNDVGVNVNLAQIALEEQRYADAIAALQPVAAAEPYHVTAAYVLGLALTRSGAAAEGSRLLEHAQALRQTGYATTFGTGYLEQGRYAEAIASTGTEPDLVDAGRSSARFLVSSLGSRSATTGALSSPFGRQFMTADLNEAGARALAASLGGGVALFDADGDDDLDVVSVTAEGQRLLRNDAGTWADATAGSGLETVPVNSVPVGAIAADYDNDGLPDLFVMRYDVSSLYHNEGKGRFADVTRAAGLTPYRFLPGAAAFVDVDHDGDVDLVVAGLADIEATRRTLNGAGQFPEDFVRAPLQLWRNNRNGTFTDITREAKLDARGHAIAIVPTDFDNHRDIDLLIVNRDGLPALYSNQRDGTFRDVAGEVGLGPVNAPGEAITAVTAGDVNKDDSPDFFFARSNGGVFAMSDGRGRFDPVAAPEGSAGATAALLADYDSDGLLDLFTWSERARIFRSLGRDWRDVSSDALDSSATPDAATVLSGRAVALADMDKDGRTDVVTGRAGALWLWHNGGDSRHQTLRVALRGLVSNRGGVGAKIQVRAGSLSSRVEVAAATPAVAPVDIVFGLGTRSGVEVVRALWPSGILQAEVPAAGGPPTLSSPFRLEELDRKPSSCPFLFTWNGERFEFVTDFLGGGEMGDWVAPGVFNRPDPVEYVRIRGDQLRPRHGRFELRVSNELEETLFLDQLQLVVIDHPQDLAVYPNEGLTDPPKPFRLYAVQGAHSPAQVVDEHGHDVATRIARLDRTYPDDFALAQIRGYAATHSLTFDVGAAQTSPLILLTGWTDYAFSSDNVAAAQAGLTSMPPRLEVRTSAGTWRALDIAIGIPVGRPQTIPVDLSGRLLLGEHEVRLTTNMRIYWDQILVSAPAPTDALRSVTLEPERADLTARGFSAELRPDGKNPPVYDYQSVTRDSTWKAMPGRFTRMGDVLPLVARADDEFVVARSGDEVALAFDASRLQPPPEGWTRTFLLRGDGFSKEMDPNSGSPYAVEPMPFHTMSRYPYGPDERYPETPSHRRYLETYNTRQVIKPLPPLGGRQWMQP